MGKQRHNSVQEYATVSTAELRPHPKNPRKGDVPAIVESIGANGFYGAVVAQKSTGYILAGNHRYLAAKESGLSEIPVIWLDIDDKAATKILLADNRTNDKASYDMRELGDILAELSNDGELGGTGYNEDDLAKIIADLANGDGLNDSTDPNYSRKIESPVYTPKLDVAPQVSELADCAKRDTLVAEIESVELPANVQDFLLNAASRHIVFDYENIAEFYSHARPEVQRLFEKSALVIIDFDQAIDQGFVKLVGELGKIYDDEPKTEDED